MCNLRSTHPAPCWASNWPSQRAMTIVATALPTRLVRERISDMNRSIPRQESNAGKRNCADCRESGGKRDKSASGNCGGSLGIQHEHDENKDLLTEGEMRIGGLCDE